MSAQIKKIDHLVITTKNIQACLEFYQKLGFETRKAHDRYAFFAGDFKINVHILGQEFSPHAQNVQVGSADFCFEIEGSIEEFKSELEQKGIKIELGVVEKKGVKAKVDSIYLRDVDGNLLEFCSYKNAKQI